MKSPCRVSSQNEPQNFCSGSSSFGARPQSWIARSLTLTILPSISQAYTPIGSASRTVWSSDRKDAKRAGARAGRLKFRSDIVLGYQKVQRQPMQPPEAYFRSDRTRLSRPRFFRFNRTSSRRGPSVSQSFQRRCSANVRLAPPSGMEEAGALKGLESAQSQLVPVVSFTVLQEVGSKAGGGL